MRCETPNSSAICAIVHVRSAAAGHGRHACFTLTSTSSATRRLPHPRTRPVEEGAMPISRGSSSARSTRTSARSCASSPSRAGRAARRPVGPRAPLPGRAGRRRWASSGCSGWSCRRSTAAPGEDGDFTSLCVAIEELGRVDQSIGITLSAGVGLGINPILSFGTEEQKQRWLPDLVAGRALAAFGLTEPDGRLRRRCDPHQGAARRRRRRVGRRRRQGVHHQLRHRHHLRRHGHRPHRHPEDGRPRSRRSWCRPARPGSRSSPPTTSSAGTPATRTA